MNKIPPSIAGIVQERSNDVPMMKNVKAIALSPEIFTIERGNISYCCFLGLGIKLPDGKNVKETVKSGGI